TDHSDKTVMFLTSLAVITNILLSYSGYLAGIRPFSGKLPEGLKNVHLPSAFMWVPPLLLSVGGIVVGLFPSIIDRSLMAPILTALGEPGNVIGLKIWHGFNLVLGLSALTIAGGLILYFVLKPS